jgi:hypothetical protein
VRAIIEGIYQTADRIGLYVDERTIRFAWTIDAVGFPLAEDEDGRVAALSRAAPLALDPAPG